MRATLIHAEDVGAPAPEVPEETESTVDTEIGIRHKYRVGGERIIYDIGFRLATPPTRTLPGLRIHVAYRVLVGIPGEVVFAKEDIESYGASTVFLSTYPYFREACQSLSARLGRTAVTLGLMTAPLQGGLVDQDGASDIVPR